MLVRTANGLLTEVSEPDGARAPGRGAAGPGISEQGRTDATAYGATAVPVAWAMVAALPVLVVLAVSLAEQARSREPVA